MKNFIEYFGISVCINDCDYKGFCVRESMLKINRHIAKHCFYRFDDEEIYAKEDVIVDSKINETTYKLFIKVSVISKSHYCNFNKYIYKTGQLYTGPGFILRDGDEDVYFVNYRKTIIVGLYEVSNWTINEYSDDKTGFSHFEWVTKQDVERYIIGGSFVKELTMVSNMYSLNFIKQVLN